MAFAAASAAKAEEIQAVRTDGALVTIDSANPTVLANVHPITGMASGELIEGLDFRPSDGLLFALGSTNRLYRIDPDSGVAVAIGPGPFSPGLQGSDYGVSFEVTGSRIRVTSDTGQNLVLDSATGLVASIDAPLIYVASDPNHGASAGIGACAWTATPAAGPVLYGIDLARGRFVAIDTPSAGGVRTIGPLGVSGLLAGGYTGLDISPATGVAYAILGKSSDGLSRVYTINLTSGAATQIGAAVSALVRGASVVPSAPPAASGTRFVGLVPPADLYVFTIDEPGSIVRTVHVRGLPAAAPLLSIAVRPGDGILYGLTNSGLYDIDMIGGTAALVGAGFAQPITTTTAGCDFDPVTGYLRAVADGGVNLVIDAVSGTVVRADTTVTFTAGDVHEVQTPLVRTIAFTGRTLPGKPSACYVLETNDALLGRLGTAALAPDEARDGRIATIGPLAIDSVTTLPAGQGFTATGARTAYAALQTLVARSVLFHVDLTSGNASPIGAIGAPGVLHGLSLEPTSKPERVTVKSMSIGLNFRKTGRDSLKMSGAGPYPVGGVDGKSVTMDVGGFSKTFQLDARGRGKLGADTIRLAGDAARGLGLRLTLAKETLAASFADEGLLGNVSLRRAPRQVIVSLTIDGKTYRAVADLSYSTKLGKSGTAATN